MGQAEYAPHDDVLIENVVVAVSRIRHAVNLILAHQCIAATGVQFVIPEFGDPQVVLSEKSTLRLNAIRVGEEQLSGRRCNLVRDGLAADGVELVGVLDLEHPVVLRHGIKAHRCCDGRLSDLIVVAIGIRSLVHANGKALFLHNGVLLAIDRGVDAHAEDVLMILSEGTWADNVAPWARLAGVNVHNRDDACRAGFDGDAGCLVEFVVEDVLVVGQRDDELDHKLASAGHNGAAGPPVRVLPVDTGILLVEADDVLRFVGGAVSPSEDTVEVLMACK